MGEPLPVTKARAIGRELANISKELGELHEIALTAKAQWGIKSAGEATNFNDAQDYIDRARRALGNYLAEWARRDKERNG